MPFFAPIVIAVIPISLLTAHMCDIEEVTPPDVPVSADKPPPR